MKQATLKIKNYVGNVKVVDNYDLNKKIFKFIAIAFAVCAFCYVVLIGNMFLNIVERKALEKQAHLLSSEVGDLELNYLALSSKVDMSLSYAMGYTEVKPSFATRVPIGVIKLAKNEI